LFCDFVCFILKPISLKKDAKVGKLPKREAA